MAFLVFVLSLVLLAAGLAGAYLSLDLLPTPPGLSTPSPARSPPSGRWSFSSSASSWCGLAA